MLKPRAGECMKHHTTGEKTISLTLSLPFTCPDYAGLVRVKLLLPARIHPFAHCILQAAYTACDGDKQLSNLPEAIRVGKKILTGWILLASLQVNTMEVSFHNSSKASNRRSPS